MRLIRLEDGAKVATLAKVEHETTEDVSRETEEVIEQTTQIVEQLTDDLED